MLTDESDERWKVVREQESGSLQLTSGGTGTMAKGNVNRCRHLCPGMDGFGIPCERSPVTDAEGYYRTAEEIETSAEFEKEIVFDLQIIPG